MTASTKKHEGHPVGEHVRSARVGAGGQVVVQTLTFSVREDARTGGRAGRQSHHGHRRTGSCGMPSRELVTVSSQQRLLVPAALLVAVQVVHAVLPGPAEGGGSVEGRVGGVILLVAAVAAWAGAWQRRPWARPLLPWTGALVAGDRA